MSITTLISTTELREKMPQIRKKIRLSRNPIPVVCNNKIDFYVMNWAQYEQWIRDRRMQEMIEDVEHTKKNGKYYANPEQLMDSLLA